MKDSLIEWTDHTFNPWIGCTKVSPGCTHCYAEALNKRWRKGANWGPGAPRQRTSAANWRQPLKWNFDAVARDEVERPRVFCASLADWLDDEVPIEWTADLLKLIHDTRNLDWLLLTKRPGNWRARIQAVWDSFPDGTRMDGVLDMVFAWLHYPHSVHMPQNVWIGTTVEDQARADERIPELLKIPARVRFLSCEPLLSEVDLTADSRRSTQMGNVPSDLRSSASICGHIHWVICGGESGAGKRAMNLDWARSLRDQCAAAGVPFFMKQVDKVQPIPEDLLIRQFPETRPLAHA